MQFDWNVFVRRIVTGDETSINGPHPPVTSHSLQIALIQSTLPGTPYKLQQIIIVKDISPEDITNVRQNAQYDSHHTQGWGCIQHVNTV